MMSSELPVEPPIHEPASADAPASHASASLTAASLFAMNFDREAVGRALVSSLGDTKAALAILRQEEAKAIEPEISKEEEQRLLEEAIKMSMEPPAPAKKPKRTSSSQSAASSGNPLWQPPRYVPVDNLAERGPQTLALVEVVEVRDGGFQWQTASAFLDTGNQHMTLVDTRYAAKHAIYSPAHPMAHLLGSHASGFGAAERWTTIHGVVPGASTRAPVVTIALKVRNESMLIEAAVCEMGSHDLLIGKNVLARLFESGFLIGAGSM